MEPLEKIKILDHALLDLKNLKGTLTATEYRYAKETIAALKVIQALQDNLILIPDEDNRNNFITEKAKLIAEPGLVPGRTDSEIASSIATRINDFIFIYESEKKSNRLSLFFQFGFTGPPCFNGRVNTLAEYMAQATGIKSDLFFNYRTSFDKEANQIEDVIYDWMEENKSDKLPTKNELKQFLISKEQNDLLSLLASSNGSCIYKRAIEFSVVS